MARTFVLRHAGGTGKLILGQGVGGKTLSVAGPSAPTLSSPTDAFVSATSGAGTVSTNVGGGTLYYVLSSSDTAPSVAQIKAGNDHTGSAAVASGSQVVNATGVQSTPTITGLTANTTYYLHFVQNATGGDSNVASADGFTTPAGGSASVSISTVTQGTVYAPAPVWLEATSLSGFDTSSGSPYDPQAIDIFYVWTVRGSPIPAFSAPQNMVSGWNDPNTMYGKFVSFVLPSAGTYDIDLWCIDGNGNTATATTQVTVVAPSYSSSNTIVFAKDGDFNGAPSGTQVTTEAALNSAIAAKTSAGFRLSFKPGETHNDMQVFIDQGLMEYVDTWTPGSVVTFYHESVAGTFNWNAGGAAGTGQLSMRDLKFQSSWDATKETGFNIAEPFKEVWARQEVQMIYMVYNCEFYGQMQVQITTRDYGGITNCRVMMADSIIEGWRSYGLTSFPNTDGDQYVSLLGNRLNQGATAMHGGDKAWGIANDHGGIRIGFAHQIHMAQNDIFTVGGWSGVPTDSNGAARLHSGTGTGHRTNAERNVIEGGKFAFEIDGQNNAEPEYGGTHIIERNLIIGTAKTNGAFRCHYGGTIIRNNMVFFPDVPMFKAIYEFYSVDPESPQASNQQPFGFYNNSFVSLETDGARPLDIGSNGAYFNTFIFDNNIHYRLGTTTDGPLDTSTAITGITPRFSQVRYSFHIYQSSSMPAVANGATWSIPYTAFTRDTGFTSPDPSNYDAGPGTVTDQAYWQAAEAAGDDLHMFRLNDTLYLASRGDFTVSYADASNIVITNTSGGNWGGGQVYLRLDRTSWLDTDLPAATAYANPSTVPTLATQSGAGARDDATTGKIAYDSLLAPGTARGGSPDRGATES